MKLSKIFKGIGLIIMIISLNPASSYSQDLLKDVTRAAGNKFKKKVRDKAVNILAEEIARAAFRPVSAVMDDWVRENMKRDSAYAGVSDDSLAILMRQNYGTILSSMNQAANLPDAYTFDFTMNVTITDEKKKSNDLIWFLTKDGSAIGFEQEDGKDKQIMVLDIKNDIVIMYDPQKNTGQALPGMMSLGTSFAKRQVDQNSDDYFNIEKRDDSKMIAGYRAGKWFVDTKAYETEAWISTETPFEWKDGYGTLFQRVSPRSYNQARDEMSGLMLESTSKEKGKRKGKYKSESKWVTNSISEKPFKIDNKEYKFEQGME